MVHLRPFGSRYRQSDDDEGCLIFSIMANRPVTQRGTRFPLGPVFSVVLFRRIPCNKLHRRPLCPRLNIPPLLKFFRTPVHWS
ncbi:hypothetical protein ID850_17560 [Xenorhabdus sp. Flor]|uniref:hypothetical protein n=1 Tax=Xenorhabdus cabanillasii TaxID=351673 RepID=UPI0019C38D49|nr:hypothetical protein [Xenorhabdus sp. Flor]MBD2816506.1 hypothetical protein [Xenorhabdus sp. Flor]